MIIKAAGAKVVFGDVVDSLGESLVQDLGGSDRIRFVHCDTSSYAEQLSLVAIHKDPFAVGEDITVEPSMREVDINLKGALFAARIGLHYLRPNPVGGDLVLVSILPGSRREGG
jgi:NAD(P)-dependent dehydrogenase (short-subunit alcohol dehydrogenase family)